MKYLLPCLYLLIFQIEIKAQVFTPSNEPSLGMSKNYFILDSIAPNFETVAGDNVIWDYSATGQYINTKAFVSVGPSFDSPFSQDFPNAQKVITIQNYTSNFINSDSTTRRSSGYVMPNTDLGDIKTIYNGDDQLLLSYPMNFGDEIIDEYVGTLSIDINGSPQMNSCYGVSRSKFDGRGTFYFPNGMVVENVVRLSLIDSTTTNVQVFGEVTLIRKHFEYYDFSQDTLPIFIHSSAVVKSGFPNPLIDQTQVLSKYPSLQTAGISENVDERVIYPNPSKGTIQLKGFEEMALVKVYSLSGQLVYSIPLNGQPIDLNHLDKGLYILEIESKGQPFKKRITLH